MSWPISCGSISPTTKSATRCRRSSGASSPTCSTAAPPLWAAICSAALTAVTSTSSITPAATAAAPTCQHLPRERWLAQRSFELLPTAYFHVVFTLPHALNPIILKHKEPLLNILFAAVSETLFVFGQNKLGGQLDFVSILHTWDQKLNAHFHLHCLVAGGVVADNGKRWIAFKGNYLFN